ncbi:CpaD family pilus assembly protein [Novosphingobium sp. KCTC 2891]|uniref:CpaD family pilus assembly protein n=1 Tax=Novosphingobium sp. KCTC 2891 TaxID=2989730 RepID=UPI0022228AC4|nr:CpaD family pilus assembly protein [Novosphingobium sp. KCTC 2891]MCW1381221.1 CpaD family pilus assembly protein [Novosphingobium sp. KCTC 2891]
MPTTKPLAGAALALSLALVLSGCGGMATNASLDSVHQPVVERNNYVLDLATQSDGTLAVAEQRRLAGWFETMDLAYGDRVSIDDPLGSPGTRASIEAVAARFAIVIAETAPVTEGDVYPGTVRVVVTRTVASVPGCPDWSAKSDANARNATSPGYGCAVNANLAAMVANKEDLVRGARGRGDTVVMSSSKAIDAYRTQEPTGKEGLKVNSTSKSAGGGN